METTRSLYAAQFNFLTWPLGRALGEVRERAVGVEILGAVIFIRSHVVVELTHTPFKSLPLLLDSSKSATHCVYSGHKKAKCTSLRLRRQKKYTEFSWKNILENH
jgi:hypothetical protein